MALPVHHASVGIKLLNIIMEPNVGVETEQSGKNNCSLSAYQESGE